MAKQNAYHPTGNAKADGIKAKTDDLIRYVKDQTAASGPETQRRAALAATAYEQAAMWAATALFSEDAVKGDDRGDDAPADDPAAP